MKPKIKFGAFDVILCILICVALGVNIYAYADDIGAAFGKFGDGIGDGGKQNEGELVDGARYIDEEKVTAEVVCGRWQMDMFVCSDPNYEMYTMLYEYDVTLTEVTQNMYSMQITGTNAEYADGSALETALVNETATALFEDGTLNFKLPGIESSFIHMSFITLDGEYAAVAYEDNAIAGQYYAIEIYRPD